MPETQVVVGGCAACARTVCRSRFSGNSRRSGSAPDRLSRQLVQRIDAPLLDLLEIAATVFVADSSIRRGGPVRADFGKGLATRGSASRSRFVIRVLERARAGALTQAVCIPGRRHVSFEFSSSTRPPRAAAGLPAVDCGEQEAFSAEDVILFSGGLNSLAGALERLDTLRAASCWSRIARRRRWPAARNSSVAALNRAFRRSHPLDPVTARAWARRRATRRSARARSLRGSRLHRRAHGRGHPRPLLRERRRQRQLADQPAGDRHDGDADDASARAEVPPGPAQPRSGQSDHGRQPVLSLHKDGGR